MSDGRRPTSDIGLAAKGGDVEWIDAAGMNGGRDRAALVHSEACWAILHVSSRGSGLHAFSLAVHSAFAGRAANAAPGLRNQILRAVSSIPDNLAEGCAKRSRRELAHYADTSYASAKEVMNDLIKSRDLGILPHKLFDELARQCDDVCRLCFALSRLPPGG